MGLTQVLCINAMFDVLVGLPKVGVRTVSDSCQLLGPFSSYWAASAALV